MDELNTLLLALYRCARETPFEEFQLQALRLLRGAIPFDIARWANGVVDSQGIVFHAPYLYNDSTESLNDYNLVREDDEVAFYCMAHSGVTLNCNLADRSSHSRALQAYARRYRHEQGLITGLYNPGTGHAASISLYGAYENKGFSEQHRTLIQLAFPHLQEAMKVSQHLQAERIRNTSGNDRWGVAVADPGGLLCLAEPRFHCAMQSEWPGSTNHVLPRPLFQRLIENPHKPFSGDRIVVAPFPTNGLIFLKARMREPIDNLTHREREVAELVASGFTHKEIAKVLDIAPSTVNNHLRAIHGRAGARNNAELSAELRLTQV
ncbi:regulatory protein, luxR family [Paraburkholderia steynii]|uniref:Regulatory protein, luxR family n=1 Tax=Paraburkholderia steynii TaxID=1245441 RepID=A0A7Z7BLU8_9BURK|nr:LuxR family transcriptional regulator [Paraburkholderia steynii]SDJ54305.1 regulatory protein, luxR family [Paraburkholderia steynii]